MQLQQQPGAADVRGRIATGRLRPVDHDGLRRRAPGVPGVKIAVAQAIAVRHRPEPAQQAPPARLVKQLRLPVLLRLVLRAAMRALARG